MYAIIEDRGTQIRVRPGTIVDIDPRPGETPEPGSKITFDQVMVVGDEASEATASIGTPYVDGATVTAEVVGDITGDKVDVIKYKRRKGYRRRMGHRQSYLRVKITDVKA